jgi:hypothetical protein
MILRREGISKQMRLSRARFYDEGVKLIFNNADKIW